MPRSTLGAATALLLTSPLLAQSDVLHLKFGAFDPARDRPAVSPALRGSVDTSLWIVQCGDRPTETLRQAIRDAGGEVHGYLPDHAHVVRMPIGTAARVRDLPGIRWVGHYEPAYRLEPALRAEVADGHVRTRRYNIVVVDKHHDKPGLIAGIRALGGRVDHEQPGSILVQATLTGDQLLRVVRRDEVLWIDRWGPPERDMNHARTQGGASYLESVAGYRGDGVRGHVYEGVETSHPDFTRTPIAVRSCGDPDIHGHCTAGIIFGNGTSHPAARGLAPDAQPLFTNYDCVTSGWSRYGVIGDLVKRHEAMFTTASWGSILNGFYTSASADTDDIVFDHDIPWTQSQSNTGNRQARPEAWAKNVFSIGGVQHFNNADPGDDSWQAGRAGRGPTTDGRTKPDLCAYFDAIHCSDMVGPAGYAPGNSYTAFGGTSGATPIVAGHNALAIEMFTDGVFGNAPRVPGGSRFENRPHFTTLKALQIANARQYDFTASSSDNRREHQGWGFPSLHSMWDNRDAMFIVDETDVLAQGDGTRWSVTVAPGRAELKISMTYADPAGNPAATITRVNDLSLRVISPSGVRYNGNHGLRQGNHSVPDGRLDERDTVENVFIVDPEPGTWLVDVIAPLVAVDSHRETAAVDADYALVVNGAVLTGQAGIEAGAFVPFGEGCPGSALTAGGVCYSANEFALSFFPQTLRPGTGYGMQVTATAEGMIAGFELYTDSRLQPPVTVATAIHDADASGAPGNALTTSTMTVGPSLAWYRTTFAQPVAVTSGQTFFLVFRTGATPIRNPGNPLGTVIVPLSTETGGTWSTPQASSWSYRVLCGGLPLTPTLSGRGLPAIGDTYDVQLSQAIAGTPAVLLLGASNTSWALGPLPMSLDPYRASGCALLVSPDAILAGVTDGQGSMSVPLTVPNQLGIVDTEVFHQFVVADPEANGLGIVLTNGARVVIGH